jgi:ferric iron reductase protein FhuF
MLVDEIGSADPMASRSPLAATLDRLGTGDEETRLVAGCPVDDGWVVLADAIADQSLIDRWFDAIRTTVGGPDTVSASFLASWLGGVIVEPVTRAIILERRAWSVAASDLLVHPHPEGWFDGLAVRTPTVWMLPGDPDAGHPEAVVMEDAAHLRRTVAAELATTLALIFGDVRRRARLGSPAMWGGVADGAGAAAVVDAVARGDDPVTAFEEAMTLVRDIAAHAPVPRVRPSLVPVAWSGGIGHEMVRGTCCLWYRTQADPDPSGEGYCSSCPRRDPQEQRRRWARWLEEAARGEPHG